MKADRHMALLYGLMMAVTSSALGQTPPGNPLHGQNLYQQHCFRCHGAKLDGNGPDAACLHARDAAGNEDPVNFQCNSVPPPPAGPYPASTYRATIATSNLVRYAVGAGGNTGSDIWASTWADDGNVYAFYGDGVGWVQTDPNLTYGLAQIVGSSPTNLTGTDIYLGAPRTAEYTFAGQKIYGLSSAGSGTLYAYTTGFDQEDSTRGAISLDLGRTWTFPQILETFNRADQGPPPSASWTTARHTGHMVSGNTMVNADTVNPEASAWNILFPADQEAGIVIMTSEEDGGYVYLVLRAQSTTGWGDTATYYRARFLRVVGANDQIVIDKTIAGIPTTLSTIDLGG